MPKKNEGKKETLWTKNKIVAPIRKRRRRCQLFFRVLLLVENILYARSRCVCFGSFVVDIGDVCKMKKKKKIYIKCDEEKNEN